MHIIRNDLNTSFLIRFKHERTFRASVQIVKLECRSISFGSEARWVP